MGNTVLLVAMESCVLVTIQNHHVCYLVQIFLYIYYQTQLVSE